MDLLPKELIHRTLNFLPPKTAARTSVLLKSWKSACDSRSTMVLVSRKFKFDRDKSLEFTRKVLERYIQQGLGVEDLTISWNAFVVDNDNQIFDSMNQWINFAVSAGNNLKQLVIKGAFCCRKRGVGRYGFPLDLRTSYTLTTLNLYKCKLVDTSESIKFPSLQNLTLKYTRLNPDIIHKTFLSGSPILKSLILHKCDGLRSLEVSGLFRITSITVSNCSSLKKFDIQAPNLRDFLISSRSTFRSCKIKIGTCDESLKERKLAKVEWPTYDKYWLQTMVSRFVSLQVLYLNSLCNPIIGEAIEISSPSLSELVIRNCKGFDKNTIINAPNLHSVVSMNNN